MLNWENVDTVSMQTHEEFFIEEGKQTQPGVVVCFRNDSAAEVETRGSPGLTGQPVPLNQ